MFLGFPCGSADEESACNAGDLGSIPGLRKSPGERKRLPTSIFWPREFHGLYSLWGCKESDTTEGVALHFMTLQPWYRSHGYVMLQSKRGSVDATTVTHHLAFVFQFGCARALCPVGWLAAACELLFQLTGSSCPDQGLNPGPPCIGTMES